MNKITFFMAPEDGGAGSGDAGSTGADGKGSTGTKAPDKSMIGADGTGSKSLVDGAPKGGGSGTPEGDKNAAEIKLKLPDGMDAKLADPYVGIAKKHGLKAEAAQEYLDLAVKYGTDSRAALEKEIGDVWSKTQNEWLDKAKKDPEIGGDKFKESVSFADKFVMRFGGEKLMEALVESGLGKHPELIRAFAKAGREISEDKIEGTTGTKGARGDTLTKKERMKRDFPASPQMWEHLPD